jgi:undecaprenyl-diphosphatase
MSKASDFPKAQTIAERFLNGAAAEIQHIEPFGPDPTLDFSRKGAPSVCILNSLDTSVISFVNSFAHRWFVLDAAVALIATNTLIKGGVITALIWWAWFRLSANQSLDRELLSCGLFTAFLSVMVSRTLADLLPYRERPMHAAGLHFQMPYTSSENVLIHWSSFPSDHAALFFALALSIFFVSRRAGIAAFCYALVIVCVPRVYMGFHYPTDILAGALIGIGTASLAKITSFRIALARPVMRWLEESPGAFYAGFFILTLQIAMTFDSLRQLGRYFMELLKLPLFGGH